MDSIDSDQSALLTSLRVSTRDLSLCVPIGDFPRSLKFLLTKTLAEVASASQVSVISREGLRSFYLSWELPRSPLSFLKMNMFKKSSLLCIG